MKVNIDFSRIIFFGVFIKDKEILYSVNWTFLVDRIIRFLNKKQLNLEPSNLESDN